MSMTRIGEWHGQARRARRGSVGGRTCVLLAVSLALAAAFPALILPVMVPAAEAAPQAGTPEKGGVPAKRSEYRLPAVLPNQFASFAGDSTRAWSRSALPKARDRAALYAAVRNLFGMNKRFAERVAEIYPKNQLEWLLITDRAADSLCVAMSPVLKAFGKAFPEEVLTAGRVAYEERIAQIVGPPSVMLGFHVAMLGDHAIAQADSLLLDRQVTDVAGVQDGVLRSLQDWSQLYDQAHDDIIKRHESQMTSEDWVLVRLQDNCGNQGADVWKITEMWVAKVGVDSTKTPPEERFAHEYRLSSKKCPNDERDVFIDMTLFQEASKELYRRSAEKDREIQEEMKKHPR
jgi:hypothetical protein